MAVHDRNDDFGYKALQLLFYPLRSTLQLKKLYTVRHTPKSLRFNDDPSAISADDARQLGNFRTGPKNYALLGPCEVGAYGKRRTA